MFDLVLAVPRLIRRVLDAWNDTEFRHILILMAGLIVIGVGFYMAVEGWSFVDSLYFCVVTLATVGYGDFVPATTPGKLFTIVFIFCGIGLFIALAQGIAHGIEEEAERRRRRRRGGESASPHEPHGR